LNPERARPLLGHNIVALERLARRSFEGTAYESQAIGELHLLRCRENLSPISFTKLVSVILRVTHHVGNEFIIIVPANHFATRRTLDLFSHLFTPTSLIKN
jgi:hypothetical protein